TPGRCSRSLPCARAAGGRLRTSTRSAADPSESDVVTGTRRALASRGWLFPAAAYPAVLACLLAACGSQPPVTSETRSGGDAETSPAALRSSDPATAPPAPSPQPTAAARPLAGITVGIDPGHNGLNGTDPGFLNHLI